MIIYDIHIYIYVWLIIVIYIYIPWPSSPVIFTCSGKGMFIAFSAHVNLHMRFHDIHGWFMSLPRSPELLRSGHVGVDRPIHQHREVLPRYSEMILDQILGEKYAAILSTSGNQLKTCPTFLEGLDQSSFSWKGMQAHKMCWNEPCVLLWRHVLHYSDAFTQEVLPPTMLC